MCVVEKFQQRLVDQARRLYRHHMPLLGQHRNLRTGDAPGAEDAEVLPAPRTVMTGVAAAIRDIAGQRAAGLLSEQEYTEQKKNLLEISFGV